MREKIRSWGDDVFGGFTHLTRQQADAKRDEKVMREVGYILGNNNITKRRLVLIIEASQKKTKDN